MEQKSYWVGVTSAITGVLISPLIVDNLIFPIKPIPISKEIQTGYVSPNKLEIELYDLDEDGQKETFLRYDGEYYLFLLDEKGKPKIRGLLE